MTKRELKVIDGQSLSFQSWDYFGNKLRYYYGEEWDFTGRIRYTKAAGADGTAVDFEVTCYETVSSWIFFKKEITTTKWINAWRLEFIPEPVSTIVECTTPVGED